MHNGYQSCCDKDLARQAQAGSMAAFEELVVRYHRRIYGFLAHSCANPSDAADVTQDTFVKAFQSLHTFNPHRSFAAWLFTIARRKCIDRHRTTRRAGTAPMTELPDRQAPDELIAGEEHDRRLWLLARVLLPDIQFQALWLKYAEEMSIAAIAQTLSRTQTHVKVLLFRARRTLARELVSSAEAHDRVAEHTEAFMNRDHQPPLDLALSPGRELL